MAEVEASKKTKTPPKGTEGKIRSLNNTVLRIIILSVVVTAAVVNIITTVLMAQTARQVAQSAASTAMDVMEEELTTQAKTLANSAQRLAESDAVKAAFSTVGDPAALDYTALVSQSGANAVVLFDASGIVCGSSLEAVSVGTDLSADVGVASALQGAAAARTTMGIGYDFALEAAAALTEEPVGVRGGVLLLYNLAESTFVDGLKEKTGDDFTVFFGNVRLSTTIVGSDGQRIVGTEMGADIAETVLQQGQAYSGRATINGRSYITNYMPMLDESGKAIGALFSGYDLSTMNAGVTRSVTITIATGLVLLLIVTLYSSRLLTHTVKRPLAKIVKTVNDIAAGEMTERTRARLVEQESQNEIGQLARAMERAVDTIRRISDDTQKLKDALERSDLTVKLDTSEYAGIYKTIVDVVEGLFSEIVQNMKQIQNVASGINERTCQVSAAAESLAQGSTEQASSVEELASTVSSIVLQVDQNAENAREASRISEEEQQGMTHSGEQMDSMASAMKEISQTSQKISVIVKAIDDLAFQTNLLALNASVEAARAGSQGKGFAVVATEVQNLAGKSAAAAKDSAELIEDVLEAIKKGVSFADQAEKGLKDVREKATLVNGAVAQISSATAEQAKMLGQINAGVEQISAVVQSNTGIAEETAAASQGLSADTQKLNGMVEQYQFD